MAVVLRGSGGTTPYATYGDNGQNRPYRSLEYVLRHLPRDVTTEPEALVLRVAAAVDLDPAYWLAFRLYDAVLGRHVHSVEDARTIVRGVLGRERWRSLPEELRVVLEGGST